MSASEEAVELVAQRLGDFSQYWWDGLSSTGRAPWLDNARSLLTGLDVQVTAPASEAMSVDEQMRIADELWADQLPARFDPDAAPDGTRRAMGTLARAQKQSGRWVWAYGGRHDGEPLSPGEVEMLAGGFPCDAQGVRLPDDEVQR